MPTENHDEFLAVTPDGERVAIAPGDRLSIDVLGPDQIVVSDARLAP